MKLKEYLSKNKISQRGFAALVGVTHGHIAHILSGRKSPSLLLAQHIENVTKGAVTVYELIDPKAPSRFKPKENFKLKDENKETSVIRG